LKELIDYQKTADRFVTIYLKGYQGTVSVGEIASKYAKNGYGGI
jgi:hypothetical protein